MMRKWQCPECGTIVEGTEKEIASVKADHYTEHSQERRR